MAFSTPSTITPQQLINYARTMDFAIPTVGLAGFSNQPALTFCNDIMQRIMAKDNPWKWNSYTLPPFYSQPYQQDYLTNLPFTQMGWIESATFTDINNPAGTPQYFITPPLQAVARLLPTYVCGVPSEISFLLNRNAVTATWPGPNTLFLNPLIVQGGGPGSNPITAITDPNGNLQTILNIGDYGVTGSSAPTWPAAGATPGTRTTDGTVTWTVMDPNGVAFRLNALATFNSNVWRFNIVYQQKPPVITSLTQTFAPIPDDLGYLINSGFLAWCHKKSDEKAFRVAYAEWLEDIQESLKETDREDQSFGLYPADSLQNPGWGGGIGSYGYPGWWGWS